MNTRNLITHTGKDLIKILDEEINDSANGLPSDQLDRQMVQPIGVDDHLRVLDQVNPGQRGIVSRPIAHPRRLVIFTPPGQIKKLVDRLVDEITVNHGGN